MLSSYIGRDPGRSTEQHTHGDGTVPQCSSGRRSTPSAQFQVNGLTMAEHCIILSQCSCHVLTALAHTPLGAQAQADLSEGTNSAAKGPSTSYYLPSQRSSITLLPGDKNMRIPDVQAQCNDHTQFSDTALLLWPMIMVGKKRGVCTWNNCQKLHNLYLVPLRAG